MAVRAFVSIKEDESGNLTHNPFSPAKAFYVSINDAMTNKYLREYTVDVALMDLKNWMSKYDSIKELAGLFSTLNKYLSKKKK